MAETGVKNGALELDRIVFYGRTLREYQLIFNIDHEKYVGLSVLDCPAGSSSFTAEAGRFGINAMAVDPMFGEPAEDLMAIGDNDIAHVLDSVAKSPGLFDWSFYPSVESLRSYRLTSLRRFIHDYSSQGADGRYINASLPALPFEDKSFDIVLSGHFLFTYADRLDFDFHLKSALELVRVSRGEVRIYPVVGRDGVKPAFFGDLLARLEEAGVNCELFPGKFEFQKGGGEVLRLTRR